MNDARTLQAVLPGYEIGLELGRGAFGVVVAGRHRQLGREVAIKRLAPQLVGNDAVRKRFLAEAQILAALDHPHVVPVFDYVEDGDVCALVMERLGGGTVWRRFVDRGFDQRTACVIALVACSGLHAAHLRGVLHRDMKPENMLFGTDRVLKVADFGIARMLGEDDTLATTRGQLLGTPAYMAPEQASGTDLGPATDVYAAGVMLYELLSGRLPHREEGGPIATVMRHMNEDALPLVAAAPTVPGRLAAVVDRSLARDPRDRFASAEDFGVAVAEVAADWWGSEWSKGLEVALRDPGPIMSSAQRSTTGLRAVERSDQVVRPALELHAAGGSPSELALGELMPMRRTPAKVPPFPTVLTWAGCVLAVVALAIGVLGLGSSVPKSTHAPGSITVAGTEVTSARPVEVHLDQLIPLVVSALPRRGERPLSASLVLTLGGVPVVHSTSLPFEHKRGRYRTTLDASSGRFLVGGKLAAKLEIATTGGTVRRAFEAKVGRSAPSTFTGLFVIVLLLIVAGYAESLLRSLRRGRRRDNQGAVAGFTVVGALGGAAASLLGWLIGATAPTLVGVAVPTVVGAVAALLGGLAAKQVGARARARRRANRLVLVARRSTLTTLGTGGGPSLEAPVAPPATAGIS